MTLVYPNRPIFRKGFVVLVDYKIMKLSALRLIAVLISLSGGGFAVGTAHAACFGSQSQLICHDNLTGNIYKSRTYRPPPVAPSRVKKQFGWMPIQSKRKLGNMTIIQGYTAGGKRWKTYGRAYPSGDYRIIGSDSRGSVQRTCINGQCF